MNQQGKRNHWANILEQQKESNLSIKQFCIDNEISYQTLYYWSKKLSESEVTT
ncbi:IS66 family insertion sequence element accessory protein TnpA [Aliivibrio salmonicida]|uniref:IS66 family insertion sequence element accessory protein TnpA n=1 Tax=Aliivibrio salmonicida TaxID=40269 RepID=UPI003D12B7EB